jgi:hypothetical protein
VKQIVDGFSACPKVARGIGVFAIEECIYKNVLRPKIAYRIAGR